MTKPTDILNGHNAYETARRRARYSKYDWIVWIENGEWHAARRSAAILKRSMLSVGTQGVSQGLLQIFCARSPYPMLINSWRVANNMRLYSIRQERGEL